MIGEKMESEPIQSNIETARLFSSQSQMSRMTFAITAEHLQNYLTLCVNFNELIQSGVYQKNDWKKWDSIVNKIIYWEQNVLLCSEAIVESKQKGNYLEA